ncbi:hypothetical protein ACIPEN_14065 [Herbaspirillum chlorophenolicum]|uniref:Transmembrane protein n=1 Tax=Herbaspirillum chlorophenolicum TaxID=211589 RepID=A0ABW8F0Y5_9BURK
MMHFYQWLYTSFLRAWTSRRFESVTFKLWACLLLLTGMVAPFGQHRWCLKGVFEEWKHGWLLFPVTASSSLFMFYQFGTKWAVFSYWLLWTLDAFSVPFLSYRGKT